MIGFLGKWRWEEEEPQLEFPYLPAYKVVSLAHGLNKEQTETQGAELHTYWIVLEHRDSSPFLQVTINLIILKSFYTSIIAAGLLCYGLSAFHCFTHEHWCCVSQWLHHVVLVP